MKGPFFEMQNKEVARRVAAAARDICEGLGLALWDVTFEKEGKAYLLTVYIDRAGGVFIEDCEQVSRALDPLLEQTPFDTMPPYTLAVSSAGLERRLRTETHLDWALGKPVDIGFYKARDGAQTLTGTLAGHDAQRVTVLVGDIERSFDLRDVASIKVHFEI